MNLKDTEVLTVPCRLAFASLFKPTPVHPTTPDKLAYQATILIPKGTDLAPFSAAIKAAMIAQWGKPIALEGNGMPLKACDSKSYSGFEPGWFSLKAKSKFPPQVVDQAKRQVLGVDPNTRGDALADALPAAEARVYAGCWCRFYIGAFAWDNKAGKGVSFNLNAVQLVRDDARLDGRKSADDIFDAIDTGDEDAPGTVPSGDADDPLARLLG